MRTYTVRMSDGIRFVWDPSKDALNIKRHGVSFAEAQTVFFDEDARLTCDPDHSGDEDRFVILGLSAVHRLLVVCHCYRDDDEVIRLISARKATAKESTQYRKPKS